MRVGIQTWGSRGDINPWIAIGQGLAESGHEVTLYFTSYSGADFSHYSNERLKVYSTKEFNVDKRAYKKVKSKKLYLLDDVELTDYVFKEIYSLFTDEVILAAIKLCQENDLIINHYNSHEVAIIAKKYNVPFVTMMFGYEFTPYNPKLKETDEFLNKYFLDDINELCRKFNVSPISNVRKEIFNSSYLNILAYSKIFLPEECQKDELYPCVGFLTPKNIEQKELPLDTIRFLEQGDAPVFFSVGSLSFFEGNGHEILEIFFEAIALSGCRAIIQMSSERKENFENSNKIHWVDYVSHDKIFPHCAGVVHHGGAGTTHTTILNACPSIIIAYAWDQFYWGKELLKLGCLAGLLSRRELDSLQLAGAINKLIKDPEFKFRAKDARRKVKREKGIEKGVRLIEEMMLEIVSTK